MKSKTLSEQKTLLQMFKEIPFVDFSELYLEKVKEWLQQNNIQELASRVMMFAISVKKGDNSYISILANDARLLVEKIDDLLEDLEK